MKLCINILKLFIDEGKDVFDLSDHCLLESIFNIDASQEGKKTEVMEREYYKTDCETLKEQFLKKMQDDIEETNGRGEHVDIKESERLIKDNDRCSP